jgi:hypothetical protein
MNFTLANTTRPDAEKAPKEGELSQPCPAQPVKALGIFAQH